MPSVRWVRSMRITLLSMLAVVGLLSATGSFAAEATKFDGKVFFDMTSALGEDAIDGMKVDQQGNLYVSGPGGLWVIAPTGQYLGTIIAPRHVPKWPGATPARRCICAPAAASTGCGWVSQVFGHQKSCRSSFPIG